MTHLSLVALHGMAHSLMAHMLDHRVALFFFFFKETSILFSIVAVQFVFPPTILEVLLFSMPSPAFMDFLMIAILTGVR